MAGILSDPFSEEEISSAPQSKSGPRSFKITAPQGMRVDGADISGEVITLQQDVFPTESEIISAYRRRLNPTAQEALFPRTAPIAGKGEGFIKESAAGITDVLSLPGRAVAAGTQKFLFDEPFLRGMAKKRSGNIVGDIVRDPSTAATAPFMAVKGPLTLAQLVKAGAASGAVSGGGRQLENVAEGRDVDPKAAAQETVLGGAVPVGMKAIAGPLKAGGKKILESAMLKGGKKAKQQGFDVEKMLEKGLAGRASKIQGKVEDFRSAQNQKIADEVERLAEEGAELAPKKSLSLIRGALGEIDKGTAALKNVGMSDQVQAAGDRFAKDILKSQGAPPLPASRDELMNFLQNADPETLKNIPVSSLLNGVRQFGVLSKFNPDISPPEMQAGARAAREFWLGLRQELGNISPAIDDAFRELAETKGIQTAAQQTADRFQRNNMLSLTDTGVLTGGGVGSAAVFHFTQGDAGKAALIGGLTALGVAINKSLKSPLVGTTAFQSGRMLEASPQAQEAIRRFTSQEFR